MTFKKDLALKIDNIETEMANPKDHEHYIELGKRYNKLMQEYCMIEQIEYTVNSNQ